MAQLRRTIKSTAEGLARTSPPPEAEEQRAAGGHQAPGRGLGASAAAGSLGCRRRVCCAGRSPPPSSPPPPAASRRRPSGTPGVRRCPPGRHETPWVRPSTQISAERSLSRRAHLAGVHSSSSPPDACADHAGGQVGAVGAGVSAGRLRDDLHLRLAQLLRHQAWRGRTQTETRWSVSSKRKTFPSCSILHLVSGF